MIGFNSLNVYKEPYQKWIVSVKDFREIPDKAASLDAYKYHIAIENHVAPHWWTEKLADAFLGHTLPFYHGAPNASDYFPADSFIPINIYNFDESLHIIRNAIAEGAYEKRIGAIKGARKQIVEKYNTFASVATIIESRHDSSRPSVTNLMICGKHALRRNPLIASQIAIEKSRRQSPCLASQQKNAVYKRLLSDC